MQKELSSDVLATVLILDKILEPTPEPFRGQPDVHFVIDFNEYIKFIRTELGTEHDWLYTPTAVLLHHIRELDQRNSESARKYLFKAFLQDMAFAVMKEVYISDALGKRATVITHTTSLSQMKLGPNDYRMYFANVKGYSDGRLSEYLSRNGYALRSVSGPNVPRYQYAIALMFLADKPYYWSSK